MKVLVINAGSSSLKYQLMDPATREVFAKGLCERIGIDGKFTYKPQVEGKQVLDAVDVAMPTHSEAIQAVLNALVDKDNGVIGSMQEIDAVGHRVVHGGEAFAGSVLITDEVMKALEDCIPLAPLHNPANITGINACTAVMGKDVPQAKILESAKEHHAEFIALSALMTTTMQRMREIVAAAKEEGITAKIIIGGAVITQEYADEIGADGYSKDAADAVKLAKSLM